MSQSSLKTTIAGTKASLQGTLDENADLKPLAQIKGATVINFKAVQRVNSCGVRDWVTLLGKIPPTAPLTYEECPMVVVKQLNAVPAFQGKAKVTSFYAPYFCESCDSEQMQLLQTSQIQNGTPPQVACPTCKKPMNFDAIPNQYLSFTKRAA